MKNELIKLNYEEAEQIAKDCFIEASGLGVNAKTHKVLLDEALLVLKNCKPGINIAAVVTSLSPGSFRDDTIYLGSSRFTCTAFQQIPSKKVIRILAYLMSLGECKSQIRNHAEQYYADLWGNGFLEAGRQMLREKIRSNEGFIEENYYVSCSFGPGFYGMPLDKLSDMLIELDGSNIGLSVGENGKPTMEKFCGGFFFITSGKEVLPSDECRDCIGHERGCLFCGGKNVIPARETCMELLRSYETPPHVVRHCIAVCDVAVRIAKALTEKGEALDLTLLEAASLLHDIARVEENHGIKGAQVAEKHGYHQVAKLIKCHMFYATDPYKEKVTEQDLLCLADRMVKEDEYVGLEDRMKYVLDKLADAGIDTERVRNRLEENRLIKDKIEAIIGKTIDSLMK